MYNFFKFARHLTVLASDLVVSVNIVSCVVGLGLVVVEAVIVPGVVSPDVAIVPSAVAGAASVVDI